ncbi:MAG: filamentous hemagglutinin N-terminal domain-containing protein, partial [Chlorobiaceae bacterium]
MNRIFNLIWSKTKERWIVVSEKVKGNGKVPSSPLKSFALLAALFAAAGPAYGLDPGALPSGGTITAGSGTISSSGAQMTVNQSSQQMIANWQSFNIGQNAAVRFNQPSVTASALNRITDQNPTQIMGSLSSNGQVFLLNPSGIIFGKTATVNVGGLVASSLTMLDSDYLAGKNKFTNTGTAGEILNQGRINVSNGGVVALIAPKVTNEGSITANSGSALLAAGNQVTLDFTGDGLISYTVDQGAVDALVENKGLIKADGGLVVMTAKAADALRNANVINSGAIEARTIENKAGRILLLSDMQSGQTTVSGTLDASAPNSGDGGFIETSGAKVKIADGTKVTTLASQGKTGTWLIDPTNFTISAGIASPTDSGIGATTLETNLGDGNVTIATSATANPPDLGDINVNAAVNWSANTLTLTAHHNIYINNTINATGSGNLTLAAGTTISAIVPVSIAGIFTLTSGTWSQTGALQSFFAKDFRIAGGTFIRATGGNGSSGSP